MNSHIKNNTPWEIKNESPKNQSLETKETKSNSNNHDVIITKSPLEELKKMKMTAEDKSRALNMMFFIDSLIPAGYHIMLYGAAGSGKTTIALHWCYKIVKKYIDVNVFYLYVDGQIGMAANYETLLEKENIADRYNILTNVKVDEALSLIEDIVKKGEIPPEKIVVVLDTFKYLNPNINNKDSNVKAMQRVKKITNLGVTFISLHHTNKDGENYAGTAEIEQDCDAILKIETAPGDDEHTRISTIDEGGRVRYLLKPRTYTFTQGEPATVKEMDKLIDPEKIIQQNHDIYYINIIKGILSIEGKLSKSALEEFLKEDDGFDPNEKERKRIIQNYEGVHWAKTLGGKRNHIHHYQVIDNSSKHINAINSKI